MRKFPVIVFEGIETSGKSTLINKVSNYLKKIKRKFIKIREPGGSVYSEIIRKLMLNNKSKFNFITDFMLVMASRSENIDKILKRNHEKKIILIDRFIDSTLAYQHYGMGIDKNLITKLNQLVLDGFKPTFTFVNIVNKHNMNVRLKKRNKINKYDKFNFSFYKKVQKGFLSLSKKKNYLVIDSNKKSLEENYQIIIKRIEKLI